MRKFEDVKADQDKAIYELGAHVALGVQNLREILRLADEAEEITKQEKNNGLEDQTPPHADY